MEPTTINERPGQQDGIVLPEFIVTRHDSNADGAARHPTITMGLVSAVNAKAARDLAYQIFIRNDYQWFELVNTKYAKPACVRAARRIPGSEGT